MSASPLQIEDLPTPAIEEWKYTNISRAMPDNLAEELNAQIANLTSAGGSQQEIKVSGQAGTHHKPELNITLKRGETLTLIETQDGEGAYWKNMSTNITLEEGAHLEHIRIQEESLEGVSTNMVHITLERDTNYTGFTMNTGGKLTRHEIHAELLGSNASCTFNGLNLLKDTQHGDTTILIEHKAPHCESNQFYRTILDDSARAVFQGKVHVHQIAQKTDGYQLANTLLLSDKAEIDVKPELEIYADDVKCSHGSTTGQLDQEPIFYLRSRGLSEAQARMLMIQAFVGEVIEKVKDEPRAQAISEKAEQWLQSVL